jgi:uncharacterized protein (TIGR02246 family)
MADHIAVSGAGNGTPEQLLQAVADGINAGDMDALLRLYETEAAFAVQPGSLAHGLAGVQSSLEGFLAMKGTLTITLHRVFRASNLALVIGEWTFTVAATAAGAAETLTGQNTDVLRQQADGTWRFVIDNPWGAA